MILILVEIVLLLVGKSSIDDLADFFIHVRE